MKKFLRTTLLFSLSISNYVWAFAPTNNKILSLPFDGNITDASSLANTLTASGTITYVSNRFGIADKAIYFNGASSLSVSPVSNFNVNGAYSISMWVKADRNNATEYLFSKVTPGRDMTVAIANGGKFDTHIANATGGAYQWCEDPNALVIDTWYQITAVYDGTNLKLYKNGALVKSLASYSPSWQGATLTIGSLEGTLNFKGAIDDLTVYNKALTAAEVSAIALEDILLYTPFDQDKTDYSTKQNTVTVTGTAAYTADRNGLPNKAFNFNGSTYLSVSPVSNFNNLTNYSVSVWVKPSSTATQYYFSKVSPGRDIVLAIDNGGKFDAHFTTATNSNYMWCEENAILSPNTWYHIVSVFDGTSLKLYKNGTLVKSLTTTGAPGWVGANLQIGALDGGYIFTGALDELKVFGKALNANEVTTIFNDGSTSDVNDFTLESADVKLAPNPAKNQVNVLGVDGEVEISVVDALGNVVLTSTQTTLNLSGVNAGLYFVKVNAKGTKTTLKLVVE